MHIFTMVLSECHVVKFPLCGPRNMVERLLVLGSSSLRQLIQ